MTRWIDEIAEDFETQSLEMINKSSLAIIQVDKRIDLVYKMMLVFHVFFRRICMRICYVYFYC